MCFLACLLRAVLLKAFSHYQEHVYLYRCYLPAEHELGLLSVYSMWCWLLVPATGGPQFCGLAFLVRRDAPVLPVRCPFGAEPPQEAAGAGRATGVRSELDFPKEEEEKMKMMLAGTTCHTQDTPSCSLKVPLKQGAGASLTRLAQARATTCMQTDFATSAAPELPPCAGTHSLNKFSSKSFCLTCRALSLLAQSLPPH